MPKITKGKDKMKHRLTDRYLQTVKARPALVLRSLIGQVPPRAIGPCPTIVIQVTAARVGGPRRGAHCGPRQDFADAVAAARSVPPKLGEPVEDHQGEAETA